MKKLFLILLATVFMCLNFTDCDDFWDELGVKTVDGYIYLPIAGENFKLYWNNNHGMQEPYRVKNVSAEELKELQENYPKESFFKEKKDNEDFYEFYFLTTVPVRKNYSIPIELELQEKIYLGDIEISYFKTEGDIISFSLSTENNEILEGVFIYEFYTSI